MEQRCGCDAPMLHCSNASGAGSRGGALRLPELAGEGELADVLPQVLHGVQEGPGREELNVSARVPVLAQGSPVYGARAINQRKAIFKQAVDEREELAAVAGGELELGGAVAGGGGRGG